MEKVKKYTKEEIESLKNWFLTHDYPQSLQLDKATYIPDMKKTIPVLIEQAEAVINRLQLHGYVVLLERIKAKLEG